MLTENRNNMTDLVKLLCFIGVVFIHVMLPGKIGIFIRAIFRACVPLFFIISGWFYRNNGQYAKRGLKYLKLYFAFSVGWYLVYLILKDTSFFWITEWFNKDVSIISILRYVFLGFPLGNEYVWYLHAIGCTLILYPYINSKLNLKTINYLSVFGIFCFLLCSAVIPIIGNRMIPRYLYRNFLFEGLPFYHLGRTLSYLSQKRAEDNGAFIRKRHIISFLALFLGIIIVLLEVNLNKGEGKEFYVGCISIITFVCLNMTYDLPVNFLGTIGRKYSLWLYLIHPIVYSLIQIFEGQAIHPILTFLNPFFVIVLTVSVCYVFGWLKESIKE